MRLLPWLLLLFPTLVFAGPIKLAWDPSPSTNVTGYVLYAHTNNLVETNLMTAVVKIGVETNLTATVEDLAEGFWYFAVTARTVDGVESRPSNVVLTEVPPPPANFRTVAVQYSGSVTGGFKDVLFFKLRLP